MADGLSKELGLNHPAQQRGATANDHVQAGSHEHSEKQSDATRDKGLHSGEKQWERPRISSDAYGLQRTTSGVNVEQAEKDFAELSRELSAISRRVSRTQSKASGFRAKDVEKAISSSDDNSDDAFDLETTLHGAREADNAAGIKSKYIGKLVSVGEHVLLTNRANRRDLG
jgi:hypothetical protein